MYCTVLYFSVVYCTLLYCTVLYCTLLYCTVLYCTVLYFTVLCCTLLYFTVLYCTVLYCIVFSKLSYERIIVQVRHHLRDEGVDEMLKLNGSQIWCDDVRSSGLRHCATSRKVAGSIHDGVIGILHWHDPFGHCTALGSTQPLKEMSTRNNSLGAKAAGA